MQEALQTSKRPWVIGFSGGKDSTAVLALFLAAAQSCKKRVAPVHIVFCDTGVEIPPSRQLALALLKSSVMNVRSSFPVRADVARPKLADTYFVRVIGRGYPPPTAMFRWCTDKLRIDPVDRLIAQIGATEKSLLVLGVRFGESAKRDQILNNHSVRGLGEGYFRSSNRHAHLNFCPVFDYSVDEVWETIIQYEALLGVQASKLLGLYRAASGECPLVADPLMPPCGSARFGCWTCTVVQRDRTTESLVQEGFPELEPMLKFRDWLLRIRSEAEFRWPKRRNGQAGLGPFRVSARKMILNRLMIVEEEIGMSLIGDGEINEIRSLWEKDLKAFGRRA